MLPLLAAAVLLGVTSSACVWQWSRGRDKDRLAALVEAANSEAVLVLGELPVPEVQARFRRVSATGRFEPRALVLADNQVHRRQAGYHVYMPLLISGARRHVLVNRGWIPASPDRSQLPLVRTPEGEVRVEGIALPANRRFLELSAETQDGQVWQNVTVERYGAVHPIPLHPFVLEQHGETTDDGLVRDWPRPESGSARHYGYAFQWAGLSILIVFLTVFFHVRRSRSETPPA